LSSLLKTTAIPDIRKNGIGYGYLVLRDPHVELASHNIRQRRGV